MQDIDGKARRKETTKKVKIFVGDNNKMDLGEIGWSGMDFIDLARSVEGSCESGNEPSGSIKCLDFFL
jgi:hypothetical protein